MGRFAPCLVIIMALHRPLVAQLPSDSVFALRGCESRRPVVGPMRADGLVATMLQPDGRIDTASTKVLQVESVSVAAYRSAAARWLATCRYRVNGARVQQPVPVVIALAFDGSFARMSGAERVPQLEGGIDPGPVLIPTQDLPLADNDPRIEESPLPDPSCRSLDEGLRRIGDELEQERDILRIEFEVDREGRIVESSLTGVTPNNVRAVEQFKKAIKGCRFMPARVGGIPVPVRIGKALATSRS